MLSSSVSQQKIKERNVIAVYISANRARFHSGAYFYIVVTWYEESVHDVCYSVPSRFHITT
jgi:hypothetical protein